ncbi:hypothetical protein FACS1894205_2310 [Alphaproteobacteria bacterium]|nr:hypothetical protein FACS1894205_2310 [Alphaproteobacteria bacterium]
MSEKAESSCSECGMLNCYRHDKRYPDFCLTENMTPEEKQGIRDLYQGAEADIARIAAEVEGTFYGKICRVEETIAFASRIGAKKIGIATCLGLVEETRVLVKILHQAGFETVAALCKVGSLDKTEMGVPEDLKLKKGGFEAACNPVLQAKMLNDRKTDLNVVMGLCVGHDSLFYRHSEAPATTLVAKDRLMGHNPVAALYTVRFYSSRLLDKTHLDSLKP